MAYLNNRLGLIKFSSISLFTSLLPNNFSYQNWEIYLVALTASFLVASCSSCVSTSSPGSWTYRTTEPRMKQFFTDNMCGYLSGSVTLISVSLMFRYWSTECRVPQILEIRRFCFVVTAMNQGVEGGGRGRRNFQVFSIKNIQ